MRNVPFRLAVCVVPGFQLKAGSSPLADAMLRFSGPNGPLSFLYRITILAVLLIAAMVAAGNKASHWVSYIILLAVIVLLAVSVSVFVSTRTDVAGDQWFIPGMDTPEKGACLNGSIVGVVFYGISMLAVIVSAFMGNFTKDR